MGQWVALLRGTLSMLKIYITCLISDFWGVLCVQERFSHPFIT